MSDQSHPRLHWPRGLNFLLGGVVVAAIGLGVLLLAGPVDLGLFGAPDVRIDAPLSATASQR
ncbi:hypothetical protein [Jannaschia aquimarina]|uniref:Uncharacterized protein n=1 Tax=Jannaschia aquimarina TaxID=935700 RepID=A0A0D1CMG6_9RHOB|nr:hypothetical protein [Jannaschia aquimarina]KIT15977.1 hypothetical protein jaqu_22470 [Jannaschia aquimarina]SNS99138.1 hypothetical protein SAMN05421775_104158 [Jannaschia aquimarina]